VFRLTLFQTYHTHPHYNTQLPAVHAPVTQDAGCWIDNRCDSEGKMQEFFGLSIFPPDPEYYCCSLLHVWGKFTGKKYSSLGSTTFRVGTNMYAMKWAKDQVLYYLYHTTLLVESFNCAWPWSRKCFVSVNSRTSDRKAIMFFHSLGVIIFLDTFFDAGIWYDYVP